VWLAMQESRAAQAGACRAAARCAAGAARRRMARCCSGQRCAERRSSGRGSAGCGFGSRACDACSPSACWPSVCAAVVGGSLGAAGVCNEQACRPRGQSARAHAVCAQLQKSGVVGDREHIVWGALVVPGSTVQQHLYNGRCSEARYWWRGDMQRAASPSHRPSRRLC